MMPKSFANFSLLGTISLLVFFHDGRGYDDDDDDGVFFIWHMGAFADVCFLWVAIKWQ